MQLVFSAMGHWLREEMSTQGAGSGDKQRCAPKEAFLSMSPLPIRVDKCSSSSWRHLPSW